MRIRVIDIETTGMTPPAEVVEIGWQDIVLDDGSWRLCGSGSLLFSAPGGIPPEAMAVHHLTPAMLDGHPPCSDEMLAMMTKGADVLAAHNAAFEGQWIPGDIACTLKAALRVWPDAPSHSNQVLRYWLGVVLEADRAAPPHRAFPDAYVTAHVLLELLKHATVDKILAWSHEPRVMPRVPIGKHRGERWADVPVDYLRWAAKNWTEDADLHWNVMRALDARAAGVGVPPLPRP